MNLVMVAAVLGFLYWLWLVRKDLKPPWAFSDQEFYHEVKRGNSYTWWGIEYAQGWWLRVGFVVLTIGFFTFMYVVNYGR